LDAEELRDDLLEQMLELGTLDGLEASEVLGEFVSDPALRIDVNSVTEEELVATELLTPYAAHQFVLARLHRGGAFHSLRELKQIPGWDIRTLRRILPYLVLIPVRDPSRVVRSLGQGSLSGQAAVIISCRLLLWVITSIAGSSLITARVKRQQIDY